MEGYPLLARDTTEQGDRPTDPAGAHGQPLVMKHVGRTQSNSMWGDRINSFTNTVCCNIGLADAVGELPYFPEKKKRKTKHALEDNIHPLVLLP